MNHFFVRCWLLIRPSPGYEKSDSIRWGATRSSHWFSDGLVLMSLRSWHFVVCIPLARIHGTVIAAASVEELK